MAPKNAQTHPSPKEEKKERKPRKRVKYCRITPEIRRFTTPEGKRSPKDPQKSIYTRRDLKA